MAYCTLWLERRSISYTTVRWYPHRSIVATTEHASEMAGPGLRATRRVQIPDMMSGERTGRCSKYSEKFLPALTRAARTSDM